MTTTYTQREFTLPQGASGTAAGSAPASGVGSAALPPQYEYAVGAPTADYFADYYATPATYAYYPAYAAYPAYYGYPSVASASATGAAQGAAGATATDGMA